MLKVPKSWDEITLSQYIALSRIDITDSVQSLPDIFSALGLDDSVVMSMKVADATALLQGLTFLSELPDGKPLTALHNYTLRQFDCLRLDEFIDLDGQITKGASENVHQIVAILYSDSADYDFRKRKQRAEEFLSLPFSSAWPVVKSFLEYRLGVMRAYKGLFRLPDPENDPFYNAEEEARQVDEFSQKWGWMQVINRLAGDDITRHKSVLSLGHVEAFNQLSFFIEREGREKK